MKSPRAFTICLAVIIITSVFTIGFMKKDSAANAELKAKSDSLSENVKRAVDDIDTRVLWTKEHLNSFTSKEYDYNTDYFDDNHLVYRDFYNIADCCSESLGASEYSLYYDDNGKWIYADISRYRGPVYSMYIHDNEILHVETGPFETGGLAVNGDLTEVIDTIKEYPNFGFILEDYGICLENVR